MKFPHVFTSFFAQSFLFLYEKPKFKDMMHTENSKNTADSSMEQPVSPILPEVLQIIAQSNELCEKQLYSEAAELLSDAISRFPQTDQLYRQRAAAYLGAGLLQEAAQDLDSLQALSANDLIARTNIYLRENQAEAAIAWLEKRHTQYPESKTEYLLLSQLFSLQHHYQKSLDILETAICRIPLFPEAYKERGRIRMILNDSKGAMEDLKKAMEQNPAIFENIDGNISNK